MTLPQYQSAPNTKIMVQIQRKNASSSAFSAPSLSEIRISNRKVRCGRWRVIQFGFLLVAAGLSQPWRFAGPLTNPRQAVVKRDENGNLIVNGKKVKSFKKAKPRPWKKAHTPQAMMKPPLPRLVSRGDFKDLGYLGRSTAHTSPTSLDSGNTTNVMKNMLDLEKYGDKKEVIEQVVRTGIRMEDDLLQLLPKWSDVVGLYGDKPVIIGTETCKTYRDSVKAEDRFVGVAGQMNTGTNSLARSLKDNLKLPENSIYNGVLWTIPWYKHSWVSLRNKYNYHYPSQHDLVMPVVMVRDPYFWMKR